MKKFAFTLAEVLITLSIVGVVAAMTMPLVINSSQNQKNAAALAVAISDWESAMAAMMSADGATDMFETIAYKNLSKTNNELYGYSPDNDINEFVSELSKYINITNYYKGFQNLYDGVYMKWLDGVVNDDYGDGNYEEFMVVTTQKGYVYGITIPDSYDGVIQQFTEDEILEAGGSLITRAGEIVIDVNGKANPNTYGRDIFRFFLGSDGMLYPQGGLDYSIYLSGDDSRTWENSDSNYDQCINISTSKGNGCTARLIENNFKMDY